MDNFTFWNPTKIVFGDDSMDKIRENVDAINAERILITYGKGSIKKNGVYDKVIDELKGLEVAEFEGIEPNPRVETLRECIELARDFKPDLILAVGGGSVIDGTKLISAGVNYDGDAWDFLEDWDTESKQYIPIATVLTLSATCSEMNSGGVITNWTENKKMFFAKPQLFPKFSILDPQNLYSLPKDQFAYGVIDTYVHVLEQYMNNSEDVPLQDRFSEGLMLTVIENSKYIENDYTSRANLMLCAAMALNGLIQMGTKQDWATHQIEHELSAFYDIPHAGGLAVIHPNWMEVVAKEQKADKMVQYGKRIWNLEGSDEEIIDQAIEKTADFYKSLGVKMSLTEWDINEENFDTILTRLEKSGVGETPLTRDQLADILDKSL